MSVSPQIDPTRKEALAEQFAQPYFAGIKQALVTKREQGETTFPPASMIFNAFNLTPFDQVKVVILGQDPYHGPGQAHGLCFSVQEGVKPPPSLVNIYKEIIATCGGEMRTSGDLTHRAEQGVLLLNAILTVKARSPASHHDIGWQQFTDAVISKLSEEREGIIFLLRGNFAKSKAELIDQSKHYVLEAAHPSPFSAYKGFFGCKHFQLANALLEGQSKEPIKRL